MGKLYVTILVVSGLLGILTACTPENPIRLGDLNGKTDAQILAQFGAPSIRSEYPMSKAAGEFRAGLRQFYPMPESRDVVIRELTWEYSRYFITAWLHQTNAEWVVFDSLRYGKHVEF